MLLKNILIPMNCDYQEFLDNLHHELVVAGFGDNELTYFSLKFFDNTFRIEGKGIKIANSPIAYGNKIEINGKTYLSVEFRLTSGQKLSIPFFFLVGGIAIYCESLRSDVPYWILPFIILMPIAITVLNFHIGAEKIQDKIQEIMNIAEGRPRKMPRIIIADSK